MLTALYRAAQEGLTNVQKHAQARHVLLDVQLGEAEACLRLHDDGVGFDTGGWARQAAAPERGYGLQGLQERLELVRGQMSITSDARTGTETHRHRPQASRTIGGNMSDPIPSDEQCAPVLVTVLVVDDQRLVREGIASLLDIQEGISVVGEAVNGQEAIEKALALRPDVVLMDVRMPVMDGIVATAARSTGSCPVARSSC